MSKPEKKKPTLNLDTLKDSQSTPSSTLKDDVPMVEICLDSPLNGSIQLGNISQVTPLDNAEGWTGPTEILRFDTDEVNKSDFEKAEAESILSSHPSNAQHDDFGSPSDIVNFEFFDDRANSRFARQGKESEEMKERLSLSPIAKKRDAISEEDTFKSSRPSLLERQDNSDELSDCTSFYKKSALNLNDGERRIKAKELSETKENVSVRPNGCKDNSEESNVQADDDLQNGQVASFTNAYNMYKSLRASASKSSKDYSRFMSANSKQRKESKSSSSASNRESVSKSNCKGELKESFEETKRREKEAKVKRKIALILIEDCCKKYILKKIIFELRLFVIRKKNATRRILGAVTRWKEQREKVKVLERYMDHCACLIQANYSKYQVRRSKSSQRASHSRRASVHKKSLGNLHRKSNKSQDQSKNELTNVQTSKKIMDYMLDAKMSFAKAYNRFINNKDDSIAVVKKVKGHSARKESEYKAPLNVENSAQKMLSMYNSVEGSFLPKSARPVNCDYFQEDPDSLMNTLRRPKKEFLRRNSRRVAAGRVNWENVSRRIDCWNPNTKSLRSQKLSPKKIPEKQSKKGQEGAQNLGRSINSVEESAGETQEQRLRQESSSADKSSAIHRLRKLYFKHHGDNQSTLRSTVGIEIYFNRNTHNSLVPVLLPNSGFFDAYNDEEYKVASPY